jgi:hypothetical protein
MIRQMLSLASVCLGCLTAGDVLRAADPRLPSPQSVPVSQLDDPPDKNDRRLNDLERNVEYIMQVLELRRTPVYTDPRSGAAPIEAESSSRIYRLEKALHDIRQQLAHDRSTTPAESPRGRLVISNLTGIVQSFSVNGFRYTIWPGRNDLLVPYRPVEAYVFGSEVPQVFGMSLWRWTGNEYEMRLEIKSPGGLFMVGSW